MSAIITDEKASTSLEAMYNYHSASTLSMKLSVLYTSSTVDNPATVARPDGSFLAAGLQAL